MKTISRWARLGLAATFAAGALSFSSVASADEGEGKAGPMMANLRIGPSFALCSLCGAGFTVQPEFGYAVALENSLYVVAAPQLTFGGVGSGVILTIPVGVQYDYALPVKNLYVTGRFLMGYSNFTGSGDSAFTIIPEIGAKYIINKMINVGAEPFSLPVHFGALGGTATVYRVNLYGGINF